MCICPIGGEARPDPGPAPAADGRTLAARFAAAALLVGLAWLVLFPPFQGPDEIVHFFRVQHIAGGHLRCQVGPDGEIGGQIPGGAWALYERLWTGIIFNYEAKADPALTWSAFAIPAGDATLFADMAPTAAYSPAPYLPQVAGTLLARLLRQPPLVQFYLGRFGNLLVFVLLLYLSIRIAPGYAWLLGQVALLPMTLSLAASLSADALTNGLSFLLTAILLAGLEAPDEPATRRRTLLAALALFPLLALCKGYILVCLLAFASPAFRRARGLVILGLLLAAAALHGWRILAAETMRAGPPGLGLAAQSAFISTHPYYVLEVLFDNIAEQGPKLEPLIGVLGWLDTPLPAAVYTGYQALLLAVPLLLVRRTSLTWGGKAWLWLVVNVAVAAVYTRLYFLCNHPGDTIILGVQGRYFLPFLPAALLVLCHRAGAGWKDRAGRALGGLAALANAGLLLAATLRIIDRYYGLW